MAERIKRQQLTDPELLSDSELEDIIRADFYGEDNYSEETILQVLDAITERKKEKQPEIVFDTEEGWKKLQLLMAENDTDHSSISLPSEEKQEKSPAGKRVFRYLGYVAACVAIIFTVMITVQAFGVNVLGTMGRWTADTFRHAFSPTVSLELPESEPPVGELQKALADMGLPTQLAPTWVPPGFEIWEIIPTETDICKGVYVSWVKPNYTYCLSVSVDEFFDPMEIGNILYQKDLGDPETYIHGGRRFYLFKNYEIWVATWSDMRYVVTIRGAESKEMLKSIINTIQEVPNE